MPAYKTVLPRPRCQSPYCRDRAIYEVFTTTNAKVGNYCIHHADGVVERLNQDFRLGDMPITGDGPVGPGPHG